MLTESATLSVINEVTHNDVTSKHFVDWFFKMEDFAGISPKNFPFDEITDGDDISVFGYFNGNKLDGIIRVDDNNNHYYLSFFFVNKTLQNQGIGQILLSFILNKYKGNKLILDVYTDNKPAIYIYKKYGFKIIGKEYGKGYRPGSPYYVMQRDV